MKWLVSMVLIASLSFVACLYLPWWSIAVMAALVSVVIYQRPLKAFLAGFSALFLLWTTMAILISLNNEHILARKMTILFFKSTQPYLLIIITGLTGAIVAGLAALSGSFLRSLVKEPALPRREVGYNKKVVRNAVRQGS